MTASLPVQLRVGIAGVVLGGFRTYGANKIFWCELSVGVTGEKYGHYEGDDAGACCFLLSWGLWWDGLADQKVMPRTARVTIIH